MNIEKNALYAYNIWEIMVWYDIGVYHCKIIVWYDIGNILQNNGKKTVFYVNSGNFPEFFKIFQKDIIIMQSGPFYNI